MNELVNLFFIEFSETANDLQKFCFITRARELQLEACNILQELEQKANKLKQQMISEDDEDSANAMLSIEEMITALVSELHMWAALKDDNATTAWDQLVNAQYAARTAMQSHNIASHLEGYINHLYELEHILFPPLAFFSPSYIIEQSKCSICGQEYSECEHIVGKAYMGQICTRYVEKVKEITEVSLVDEPANKRARITKITDDNGIWRDIMTWRVVSNDVTNT